jgi:RNase adaptor protein for sRNA GlmZ degradation
MLAPEQKAVLLAKIDQEIDYLVARAEAIATAHPLSEDDCITREVERESEQLAREADRLHDFREAIEGDSISPIELSYFVDQLVKRQRQQ